MTVLQSASETEELRDEDEMAKYKDQLRTLTASLATVSQEKSKMEANFQADKKKIKVCLLIGGH